ncbi:tetratricopeptide repeat protein [Hansschlegelia quercus]|uniref:Tetratricopeptide repeat protein n=1 Tax=Hansschlegelia quercus TaxID=2528245 RepID=A0A4Q9GNS6_9HYPH|nr:tetratricopeptide repeat protein [Hansschlegelia quercus]
MLRIAFVVLLIVAALGFTDGRGRLAHVAYEAGSPRVAALLIGGPAWRGVAHYEAGRYPQASAAFREDEFPGRLYDLGTALAREGRLKEASEAFDDALERDPNDEDARYNLAVVEAMLAKVPTPGADAKNPANASANQNKRGGEAPSDAENEISSTGLGAAGDRDSGREANSAGPSKVLRTGRANPTNDPNKSKQASGSIGSSAGIGRTGDSNTNVAKPYEQPALRSDVVLTTTVYASRQWLETLPDDPGAYVKKLFAQQREARKERGLAAPEVTDPW